MGSDDESLVSMTSLMQQEYPNQVDSPASDSSSHLIPLHEISAVPPESHRESQQEEQPETSGLLEHHCQNPSPYEPRATAIPPHHVATGETSGGPGPTALPSLELGQARKSLEEKRSGKKGALVWQRTMTLWNHGWTVEIVSCTMAVLALLAIIITLYVNQGQTLPELPFGITLNAIIAIFGVLLKTGLSLPLSEGE
jgi:hypothetical protein